MLLGFVSAFLLVGFVSAGSISITSSTLPGGGFIAASAVKSGDGSRMYYGGGYSVPSCGVLSMNALVWSLQQQPGTATVATLLGGGRAEMGAAAASSAGTAVFYVGGFNGTYQVVDSIDRVDGSVATRDVHRLSVARAAMVAARVGNLVVFAGGARTVNVQCQGSQASQTAITYSNPTNAVDIYSLATNSWSTSTKIVSSHSSTAVVSGTRLYITGGRITNGGQSATLEIYDSIAGTWSQRLAPGGIGPFGVLLPSSGNIMFSTGGSDPPYLFNPTTISSTVYPPVPFPVFCGVSDGHMYGLYLGNGAVGFFCFAGNGMATMYYTTDNGATWMTSTSTTSIVIGKGPVIVDQRLITSTGTMYSLAYDPSLPPDSTSTGQCCGASLLQPAPLMLIVFFAVYSLVWFLWV